MNCVSILKRSRHKSPLLDLSYDELCRVKESVSIPRGVARASLAAREVLYDLAAWFMSSGCLALDSYGERCYELHVACGIVQSRNATNISPGGPPASH